MMSRRKDEARDSEECREVADEQYHLSAWEFRQWLVSHYRDARNPAECLAALVAALYGRLGRQAVEYDYEPEEIAGLFDEVIGAVDAAGIHHALIHVTEAGAVAGLDARTETGASTGAGRVSWTEYASLSAVDDARDMVEEKAYPACPAVEA